MERVKQILTKTLITFALISLGFVIGKHSAHRGAVQPEQQNKGTYVAVFYMHSTFRCVTCNTIEKMTKELLDKSYSQDIAEGRIKWQDIDFQENEPLAAKFKVVASCVVVAEVRNGVTVDFKRLDKVWTLMKAPDAINKYISTAIDSYLKDREGEK